MTDIAESASFFTVVIFLEESLPRMPESFILERSLLPHRESLPRRSALKSRAHVVSPSQFAIV